MSNMIILKSDPRSWRSYENRDFGDPGDQEVRKFPSSCRFWHICRTQKLLFFFSCLWSWLLLFPLSLMTVRIIKLDMSSSSRWFESANLKYPAKTLLFLDFMLLQFTLSHPAIIWEPLDRPYCWNCQHENRAISAIIWLYYYENLA